jgi:hypothetical protein
MCGFNKDNVSRFFEIGEEEFEKTHQAYKLFDGDEKGLCVVQS